MNTFTDIDWTNRACVCTYADTLGPGMVVIKYATRANYNITHASRTDRWLRDGVSVIHVTQEDNT